MESIKAIHTFVFAFTLLYWVGCFVLGLFGNEASFQKHRKLAVTIMLSAVLAGFIMHAGTQGENVAKGDIIVFLLMSALIYPAIYYYRHKRIKKDGTEKPNTSNTGSHKATGVQTTAAQTKASNSEALFTLDAVNDTLEVFEKKVVITPKKNLSSVAIRGMKGSKSIPYATILAIQFREANPINGYLQFTLQGAIESGGGIINAISDENTVFFTKRDNELAEQIRDYIEEMILNRTDDSSSTTKVTSLADELAKLSKLHEDGALSKEEFDKAKAAMMG